jgi:hypothetical protein
MTAFLADSWPLLLYLLLVSPFFVEYSPEVWPGSPFPCLLFALPGRSGVGSVERGGNVTAKNRVKSMKVILGLRGWT